MKYFRRTLIFHRHITDHFIFIKWCFFTNCCFAFIMVEHIRDFLTFFSFLFLLFLLGWAWWRTWATWRWTTARWRATWATWGAWFLLFLFRFLSFFFPLLLLFILWFYIFNNELRFVWNIGSFFYVLITSNLVRCRYL